jgi:hypothetical protein
VAISRVDEAEALRTLQDLRACGDEPLSEEGDLPANDTRFPIPPMSGPA